MKDCWKKKEKSIKSIGIAGCIRGSGATHLSVALANYAASGLDEKTAYLELYGHGEIIHWKETNEKGYFTDQKIHYYPEVKQEETAILFNCGYEKIIMDFGDAYIRFREEILRCDQKVFLLNLNPWQKFAAEKMIEEVQKKNWGDIQPLYVSVNAQKIIREEIERKHKIQVMDIFSIPDPRCVREREFFLMDYILESPAVVQKRRKSLLPIRKKI